MNKPLHPAGLEADEQAEVGHEGHPPVELLADPPGHVRRLVQADRVPLGGQRPALGPVTGVCQQRGPLGIDRPFVDPPGRPAQRDTLGPGLGEHPAELAMDRQVRVAPDGRGEVQVAGAGQAEVGALLGRVARLHQAAQQLKGERYEACQGGGQIRIEMHFLPDMFVTCEACSGRRFNRETLEIQFRGRSIHQVLRMTVDEAREFFSNQPKILRKLQTLADVGLGYVQIGQPATTLSGGEAQRVKLAHKLSKHATGRTLYILDEPTTSLHPADIRQLIEVLDRLVDTGNKVVVIEHNLDVIKQADWIIDLGPGGGDQGGRLVVQGNP